MRLKIPLATLTIVAFAGFPAEVWRSNGGAGRSAIERNCSQAPEAAGLSFIAPAAAARCSLPIPPVKADIYVNPASSDACDGASAAIGVSGSCAKKTVDGAKLAVRALIAANPNRSYDVLLAGGSYPRTAPLVFTNLDKVADTPAPQTNFVTYKAAPGTTAIIEGGYKITGWTNNGDGTWSANLVNQGLWPGPATGANAGYYFASIWVNGVRRMHPIVPDRGTVPFYTAAQRPYQTGVGKTDTMIFTSGNPNIVVGDIDLYQVGMQVNFGASSFAGLTPNAMYVVSYYNHGASPYLQLTKVGGTVFTPNASTAPKIDVYYHQTASSNWADNWNSTSTNAFGYNATIGVCPSATAQMCAAWSAGLTGDEKVEIYTTYASNLTPVAQITETDVVLGSRIIDPGGGLIIAGTPFRRHNFPQDKGQLGHFYLTRAGVITYAPMPGEDMTTAEIYAPYAKELLRVSNAAADGWTGGATSAGNLKFSNLTFQHTNSTVDTCEKDRRFQSCGFVDGIASYFMGNGAIHQIGSKNVVFDGLEVSHTQESGIKSVLGSNTWTVKNSKFIDIGGSAVVGGGGFTLTSYLWNANWGGPATTPATPYYKSGDAGTSNVNDGNFEITNNEVTKTGVWMTNAPGLVHFSSDNWKVTHNWVHDTDMIAAFLGLPVNKNALTSNETRGGYVAYNRFENAGGQENVAGVRIPGFGCHNDAGIRYSYGNLGGDGSPAQRHVEEFNVYSGFDSCAFQVTNVSSLKATGSDGIACYFDGNSSFNITFRHNICANSSNRLLQLTGLLGQQFYENIFYSKFTRGITDVRQASMIYPVAPTADASLAGPYAGGGPNYAQFHRNVVAVDTNGTIPASNYYINAVSGAPYSVDATSTSSYAQFTGNVYWKYDTPLLYFGSPTGKTFAAWQAITGAAGAPQDVGGSIQDPNINDFKFRSPALFASTGNAPLCSDRVQRSPICGVEGGFLLWDPTQSGLLKN